MAWRRTRGCYVKVPIPSFQTRSFKTPGISQYTVSSIISYINNQIVFKEIVSLTALTWHIGMKTAF